MPSYDLLKTYVVTDDGLSVTPHWVLAVVRFKNQVTFDRTSAAIGTRSYGDSDEYAVEEAPTLIISSDCIQLNVSSSKGAHTTALQALLLPRRNYEEEINPGDWVLAWMLNSEDDTRTLVERIKSREPCNRWQDGFKFMGRVQGISEDATFGPEGEQQVMYSLSAAGFTEFDAAVLYFPQIAQGDQQSLPKWWINFGLNLKDLAYAEDAPDKGYEGGTLNINKVLPAFIKVLLGEGLPPQATNPDVSKDPRLQTSPNSSAYLVPQTVSLLLGKKPARSVATYADLLEGIIGVQHYSGSGRPNEVFFPDVQDSGPMYMSPVGLAGEFVPLPPPLDMVPVWNVLGMYLNSAINEMYVTLRVNKSGHVVPYFIARQLPFTSRLGATQKLGLKQVTPFSNLPRWIIPPNLLHGYRLGRNDAARFNLVQAMGVTSGIPQDASFLWVQNPPVRDDADLKRSGLRPFQRTVNCSFQDSTLGAKAWTNTLADFMIGMHRTRNGTISLFGIHAPIAVGDNVELLGNIYHIETIAHSCTLDPEGMRNFETTLMVSHGVPSDLSYRARVRKGATNAEADFIDGDGTEPTNVSATETN